MVNLLEEEELRFQPLEGQFDVAEIEARIATLGFSFRDEAMPSMHVVTSTAAARDTLQAQRRANPDGGFPHVLLIQVAPEEINVAPSMDGELAALSAEFMAWLAASRPCRLFNDFGTDLTAELSPGP